MKNKHGTCPVMSSAKWFWTDDEQRKRFEEAEPAVRAAALALLEQAAKNSIKDVEMKYLLDRIENLEKRIRELEACNGK